MTSDSYEVPTRDGARIHVRVAGTGTPVLLLHGLGTHSGYWMRYIQPFLTKYRFYMPDFRGSGGSSAVRYPRPDIFAVNAEDAQDVVAHFKLNNFALVGFSLGASTALHWLKTSGWSRVTRYLHIDQAPCVPHTEDWSYGLFGRLQRPLFASIQVMAWALETVAPFHPALGNRHAWAWSYLHAHDYRSTLARCSTPVTFFIGMRSLFYPAKGQLVAAGSVQNHRVVRFERSGHMLAIFESQKFREELGRFLAAD